MTNNAKNQHMQLHEELLNNKDINHNSVNGNVLAKILNAKIAWLSRTKEHHSIEFLKANIDKKSDNRSFYDALSCNKTSFILECKKASPSKGLIREDFNVEEIAKIYNKYASAISVLTDEDFFMGDYKYLEQVKNVTNIPVLCKDFIFTQYQIYLAKYYNADACLLMLSVLTDDGYLKLSTLAHSLGLDVLTEASTEDEITRAIKLNAKIIGINNRNLRTLSVDLNNVRNLAKKIPNDRIIISESGIYTHDQILDLKKYAKGFLVGSSLTSEENIDLACRKLIYGENKVCGITRYEDIIESYKAGAIYNGFIFAQNSKRFITKENAKTIAESAQKSNVYPIFVGVFVNSDIRIIADMVSYVPLKVVQLHGNESIEYIKELKSLLPKDVSIWKAIGIENNVFPIEKIESYLEYSDKILLDVKNEEGFGGLGKTFDWTKITGDKSKFILAGGLNPTNIQDALNIAQCCGLDFNSGLESSPGIKNHQLIKEAFKQVKNY